MDALRVRFFLCFILVWGVSGNLLATLVSSAGPVYYAMVTGDAARFAELTQFLSITSGAFGSATDTQAYLWNLYVNHVPGFGSGISAFPSVHLGFITVIALFFRERWPRVAWVGYAYVGLVLVTSVYLGWHYAIDGYASILLSLGYYLATRGAFAVRWVWPRKPEPVSGSAAA